MKISLSGPSYTLQSVVAAAQQTMNWYPETIASPEEPRRQVLFGRPGLKFFAQLTPIKIRCLWAGGGRLFAIHADTESEIHEDASIHLWAGGLAQGGGNPDPAQIFSNGHQLMVVSGNKVYCDNGSGAVVVRFSVGGTCSMTGTDSVVHRLTGVPFAAGMVGHIIRIDDIPYSVVSITNPDTL